MRKLTAAKQKGQVLILTGLGLVVLVGSVGLAVDSGIGYMSRAKLNAAVDSAGIAAARAVTQGNDQATQTASAQLAAKNFFNANYPSGYLGTVPTDPTVGVTFNPGGQVTIDVSAQATRPVSLMGVLGFNQMTVGAASETVRKDLDLAFVMDTSGSMAPPNSPPEVPIAVRAGGVSLLEGLTPTTDRVALIHFAGGAVVDDAINLVQRGFNRQTMEQHINNLQFTGFTNSAEGMWNGRDQLNSIALGNRSTLRVIVFFSDGTPNTFSSYFPFASNPGNCGLPVDPKNNKAIDGAIATGDNCATGNPDGLYVYNQQETTAGNCYKGSGGGGQFVGSCRKNGTGGIASAITGLPNYYNAHNPADTQFRVVTNGADPYTGRTITSVTTPNDTAWKNINLASRNLLELISNQAKSEGIYIFTLGLGSDLKQSFGVADPNGGLKTGEELLKCMANTAQSTPPDTLPARCHDATKPIGSYCYAATPTDLKPCYTQLLSQILHIAK